MAGSRTIRDYAGALACLLLFLLITYPLSSFAENSILILKSNENNFFNTTIEGLIDKIGSDAKFNIRSLQEFKLNPSPELEDRLIITLGFEAASYINELDVAIPVIHSYLTEFQHLSQRPKIHHSSVLLEQTLDRYVHFIKLLLSIKSIGILKSDGDQINADKLQILQQKSGLKINQSIFAKGDNPVVAVRRLLKNNDVLLTLPAPDIYNRQSLKGILLASYRMNKPVISYSPAHVKAGALAAIYISPEKIGQQLAELVVQLLNNKGYTLQPVYYAADYSIAINKQVAESLNIELAEEQQILRQLHQAESP